ncbi:MAG TPA: tetratricopeptide repeat protein [Blastocatellia bacterium]|nr:tetratricopeptide repeat protein [Blastocatellia bacterium]
MARQHISTEQLKHDPLMDQYLKTSAWVKPRTKPLLIGVGALVAIIALFFLYQWYSKRSLEKAGNAYLEALKIDSAIVADPLPPAEPGTYAFKTEAEKTKAAVEAFEKVAREYPQYHDVASYYAAVRQLRSDGAAKGEEVLKRLAEKNSTVSSQARLTLAERYEATGKHNEAVAEYLKLKANPDEVPMDLIEFNLARTYEAMGKTQEATDLYFNVASRNREKPTAVNTEALNKLTLLDPARVEKLPEVKREENPDGPKTIIR